MLNVETMCHYCWRPGVLITRRRHSWWRRVLGLPRPTRRACPAHIPRAAREV